MQNTLREFKGRVANDNGLIYNMYHTYWRLLRYSADYLLGSDVAELHPFRCITQQPSFNTVSVQREVLETAIVGLRVPREITNEYVLFYCESWDFCC